MSIDDFIRYIEAEKRYSPHTVRAYERDVRDFVEYVCGKGEITAQEFDPAAVASDDVRSWIVSLSGRRLGPASINRMASSLRAYFRYLRGHGVIDKDPMLRIGNLKKPLRLPEYIPESRMEELIVAKIPSPEGSDRHAAYIAERDALIILLFYSTGIRLAELKDIRLEDFSDGFSQLRVRGKGGKERIVPVIEYARERIGGFIRRFEAENICVSPGNFLFLTEKGEPVSRTAIYNVVRGALTSAGIQGKKSPHVLRHSFATHLLNGGADIREIQELLGHSSLAATQVYTHNSITKLKEIYTTSHPRGAGKKTQR